MTNAEVDASIYEEIVTAERRYGDFTSSHEGLGVLMEELHELVQAIRANKSESIRTEAIQVAAVATRIAYAMSSVPTLRRSGCEP